MAETTNPLPDAPIGYIERDPITGRPGQSVRLDTEAWDPYFRSFQTRVENSPERLKTLRLTGQTASIAATPLELPALPAGYYRIGVYAQITRAATSSSSLTVTISHTHNGDNCAKSTAAMTGNLVTTTNDPFVHVIRVDEDTPINYATTYATSGATDMEYELNIIIEAIPESE